MSLMTLKGRMERLERQQDRPNDPIHIVREIYKPGNPEPVAVISRGIVGTVTTEFQDRNDGGGNEH